MKINIFLSAILFTCTTLYSQSKFQVQLSSVLKKNNRIINVSINNISSEKIFIYSTGFITDEGIIASKGPSNMIVVAYSNQNAILSSSETRPLTEPGKFGRLITLSPGVSYNFQVALYDHSGGFGLFNRSVCSISSIIANVKLCYKTETMPEYESIQISSAPLILNQ